MRTSLRLLHGICVETGATAILIQHLNKQPGGNVLYRVGGSVGWIAMARSALLVGEHPRDPEQRIVAHLKSNLAPRGPSLAYRLEPVEVLDAGEHVRLEWLGEVDLKAGDLLRPEPAEPRETAASPLQGEIKGLVAEYLADGPKPAKDALAWLAEGGFKSRSIDAATAELVRDGLLRKRPDRKGGAWLWEWRQDSAAGPYPLGVLRLRTLRTLASLRSLRALRRLHGVGVGVRTLGRSRRSPTSSRARRSFDVAPPRRPRPRAAARQRPGARAPTRRGRALRRRPHRPRRRALLCWLWRRSGGPLRKLR